MILLDENIRDDQIILLRSWRIRVGFLVEDVARPGIKDLDIIPLLHHLKQPVLFSHDQDFFKRDLVHPNYCLVWLNMYDGKAAKFIRAFLKQPLFNSAAKRMGVVARAHVKGINYWRRNSNVLEEASWET